jgi:hypothetical protein
LHLDIRQSTFRLYTVRHVISSATCVRCLCASNFVQKNQRTSNLILFFNEFKFKHIILIPKGAFWGLIIGLGVGLIRFIWQFSYVEHPCVLSYLDERPLIISKVHFLHFGVILFLITCISSWAISLITEPIPEKYVNIVFMLNL